MTSLLCRWLLRAGTSWVHGAVSPRRVSFCTFLAHEYPDLVHKVIMINGGGPTALEPSLCSIFNMPTCVLHCLSPCLAWSFLK